MQAIIIAAGLGSRLYGNSTIHPHKALLVFRDRSLLQRHIEALQVYGITRLILVIGYRPRILWEELVRIKALEYVSIRYNPSFHRGSVLSLWAARDVLQDSSDVLLIDADVLYHHCLVQRLVDTTHRSCLLVDHLLELTDEPVQLYTQNSQCIELQKVLETKVSYDSLGEWPGLLRLASEDAKYLKRRIERLVTIGRLNNSCDGVIRDEIVARGTFFSEDITGLPWIEIDFPTDIERAVCGILSKLL